MAHNTRQSHTTVAGSRCVRVCAWFALVNERDEEQARIQQMWTHGHTHTTGSCVVGCARGAKDKIFGGEQLTKKKNGRIFPSPKCARSKK